MARIGLPYIAAAGNVSFFAGPALVAIDRMPIFAKMLPQSTWGLHGCAAGNVGRSASCCKVADPAAIASGPPCRHQVFVWRDL